MLPFSTQFVPDAERLAHIFSTATAPTFFLGAVAAFPGLMTSRMEAAMNRVRALNSIPDTSKDKAHLKSDVERLIRRARLLKSGIFNALAAGVCATLLLANLFVTEFIGLKYAYGAGILFLIATMFLGIALVRFGQEVRISLHESDNLAAETH
jgi:hypothetical protein